MKKYRWLLLALMALLALVALLVAFLIAWLFTDGTIPRRLFRHGHQDL